MEELAPALGSRSIRLRKATQLPIVQVQTLERMTLHEQSLNAFAPCHNTKCMRQTFTRIAALLSVSVMSGLRAALPIGEGLLPLRSVGF